MDIKDLINAGFTKTNEWHLNDNGDGVVLNGDAAKKPGIYVFVVDGIIRYVGSAQRGLHSRFRSYVIAKTLKTSARVRKKIIECLNSKNMVCIYTLHPPEFSWNGLPLDIIAGLEEAIITSISKQSPDQLWNIRSNRKRS